MGHPVLRSRLTVRVLFRSVAQETVGAAVVAAGY